MLVSKLGLKAPLPVLGEFLHGNVAHGDAEHRGPLCLPGGRGIQVRPERGTVLAHHAEIPAFRRANLREFSAVEVEAVLVFSGNEPAEGLLHEGDPGHTQPRGGIQIGLQDHS